MIIKMVGGMFKAFGAILNGAGTAMAGGALLASTSICGISDKISHTKEQPQTEQQPQTTDIDRRMRNVSGKYKIVDIDNELEVLTSSDDLQRARAWLCEYRTNGYNVMIQSK